MNRILTSPLFAATIIALSAYMMVVAAACDESGTSSSAIGGQGGYEVITIDISSGADPSCPVNCSSPVKVIIRSTETFTSCTIDPSTVLFAGVSPGCSICRDVNNDGRVELELIFCCGSLKASADGKGTLTGRTFSGTFLQGEVAVPQCK